MAVYICGDSTAASYPPEDRPLAGWGQMLSEFLPGTQIVNRAVAGRSTRTFLEEGRLQGIEPELEPGDWLLVQFGHNDESDKPERHTQPWTSYVDNLSRFIDAARRRDARPVLLTPICLRTWENGALQPSHGDYPEAMRALARRRIVPLIDLYAGSLSIVRALGEVGSRALYMHLEKGEFERYPDGRNDDAHTREAGARAYAEYVAKALKTLFR